MNSLFIVGNKRSGSTLLMDLLNKHKNIYVSNESDIAWILYRLHNNMHIVSYPNDSPKGMNHSLAIAKDEIDLSKNPWDNFVNYQLKLLKEGFLRNHPEEKTELKYVGDQKPFQNCDPDILPFTLSYAQNPKFLHIVRHPYEVISSSLAFKSSAYDNIWKDMGPKEVFDLWEKYETWVSDAIQKHNIDCLRVYYRDLISKPKKTMSIVFNFLELEVERQTLDEIDISTVRNFKPMQEYTPSARQITLMEKHEFDVTVKPVQKSRIQLIRKLMGRTGIKLKTLLHK